MNFSTKLKNLEAEFTRVNYSSSTVLNDFTKHLYNLMKSDFLLVDVDTLDDLQSMYAALKNAKMTKEQSDLIGFIDKRKYS